MTRNVAKTVAVVASFAVVGCGNDGEGAGPTDAGAVGGSGGTTAGGGSGGGNAVECGDSVCDASESCSSCEADCGACPPDGGGYTVQGCSGATVDVTPATIDEAIASHDDATFLLAPGKYGSLTISDKQCVELRCTAPAMVSDVPNRATGCHFDLPGENAITVSPGNEDMTFVVDGMVVDARDQESGVSAGDYGVRIFSSRDVRISNSAFVGETNHEVSFKHSVEYAEVLDNYFECRRVCVDAGQELSWIGGGIDWQCGTVIVRGNEFSFKDLPDSGPNAVNNINVTTFIVDDNLFGSPPHDNSVMVWALRGSDAANRDHVHPKGELRSEVTNNTFESDTNLRFYGRGSSTDTVLVSGNTGPFECSRYNMRSDDADNISDEVSLDPPALDPASLDPC